MTALKVVHVGLVLLSLTSFCIRFLLRRRQPVRKPGAWTKIVPPVLDTALLASGVTLALNGGWLEPMPLWLLAKLLALLAYIGCGVVAMRLRGIQSDLAFSAALVCFAYIASVATSKTAWLSL